MTFETSKILGGIGALLLFICGVFVVVSIFIVSGFLQYLWIFGLAGVILLMYAMFTFSRFTKKRVSSTTLSTA